MVASSLIYSTGKPGMVASHSYKHVRQMISDNFFINTRSYNLMFGTAAVRNATDFLLDNVNGNPATTTIANFIGIFQDPEKYADQDGYKNKDLVSVVTMGDIWVRVDPAITIRPWDDVFVVLAQGATQGHFTNVAASNLAMNASGRFGKFLTGKKSGNIAVITLA